MSVGDAPTWLREVAAQAARAGGAAILASTAGLTPYATKSSPTDPVTEADRAAEAAVASVLLQHRPDDTVLGEEQGTVASGTTDLRWVVDGLDGSVNHLYGIPQCCVSVACERTDGGRRRIVAAAVLDVGRDELFTAAEDDGADLDGTAISVNDPVSVDRALVAVEYSYRAASRHRQGAVVAAMVAQLRDVRSFGSSALDLCWTACGRLDGFAEDELEYWDHAAGALLVREAGGLVTSWGSGVVAAGPALHPVLVELVGGRGR